METSDNAVLLKNNDSNSLYKEIKKLILNNVKRKKIQNSSRKNIKHLIKDNTKIIDQIRESCFPFFYINLMKKKIKNYKYI